LPVFMIHHQKPQGVQSVPMHSQKNRLSLFKQEIWHLCGRLAAVQAHFGVTLTPEPIFL
jgi:hypothetical protein